MAEYKVILGGGESGVGAALLANKLGHKVFLSDSGKIRPEYAKILDENGIQYEAEGHDTAMILGANEVIKSPGIPEKAEIIKKIRSVNIPVISEIEFAGRHSNAIKIGVTGSNGKTTTSSLIYHILKKAGKNVILAGNIGKSFAAQVADNDFDYCVLEISSFQLDDMYDFKADVSVLLNITPDHLDRYDYDFNKYVDSKFRIIQNQTKNDVFIYCNDDAAITEKLSGLHADVSRYPFSINTSVEQGACINNEEIQFNLTNKSFNMSIHQLALQGKHNLYNSMAAGIAARVLEIKKDLIRESLSDFQNIEHRLEFVAKIHGISFINDSKATNVNSTWYALESIQEPIIWIVGGVDKGNDYESLKEMVTEKVKVIICLGKDNKKIQKAFGDIVPVIVESTSAKEAVDLAYENGKSGDFVLLSPACASFDLFENYEDRGHKFKSAVRSL